MKALSEIFSGKFSSLIPCQIRAGQTDNDARKTDQKNIAQQQIQHIDRRRPFTLRIAISLLRLRISSET